MTVRFGEPHEEDAGTRFRVLPFTGACRRCKTRLVLGSTWIADIHLDGERPRYARLCESCAQEVHNLIWHSAP